LSYFAQKCIKFHLQPSRFQKFSSGRKSQTYAYRGGGGNKGFLPLKEGDVERTGRKRGEEGPAAGGSCSKVLWGRRPCLHSEKLAVSNRE